MDYISKIKQLKRYGYRKYYIYGYINCLWSEKLITLEECIMLNNIVEER